MRLSKINKIFNPDISNFGNNWIKSSKTKKKYAKGYEKL